MAPGRTTLPVPPQAPVQRAATLALLDDLGRRLDRAGERLDRLEAEARPTLRVPPQAPYSELLRAAEERQASELLDAEATPTGRIFKDDFDAPCVRCQRPRLGGERLCPECGADDESEVDS